MVQCTFCGSTVAKGTGMVYVKTDGKVLNFCSAKCERNMLGLGRKAQNVYWTAERLKAKQERLAAMKHQQKKDD